LLRKAAAGEEIIIARGATPVARLMPIAEKIGQRQPGALIGKLVVGKEFFDELPPDELAAWS